MGRVDEDGEFTGMAGHLPQSISHSFLCLGPDIAYLYPDLSTALVGNFKSGELVSGQVSSLISVRLDYGAIQVVILKEASRKCSPGANLQGRRGSCSQEGDLHQRKGLLLDKFFLLCQL